MRGDVWPLISYGTEPAACRGKDTEPKDDPRTANLSLRARPFAGAAQTVRDHHAQDLGKARHSPGWFLDRRRRRFQQRPLLSPGMGIACRAREEVDGLPERSRMDRQARRDREGRADPQLARQPHPPADLVLLGEIGQQGRIPSPAFCGRRCLALARRMGWTCIPLPLATWTRMKIYLDYDQA